MMNSQEAMVAVWDTDTIYEESFTMVTDKNGITEAPFLYTPIKILRVTSADGQITYEKGVDWDLVNGQLRLLPNSRIHAYTVDELYPKEKPADANTFPLPDGYLLYGEKDFFIKNQIAVTYTCKRGEWSGIRPQLADTRLPRTFSLLRGTEPMNLLFYGDSITAGAQSSGALDIPPYQPCYGKMLHKALCGHYGEHITYTNTAVGGKETNWAVEAVNERVNAYAPDLVVLAFGMNDGDKAPAVFENNIRTIIRHVREKHPLCEFILVATSLPNSSLTDPRACFWGNQQHFKERLDAIAADTNGVAVANIRDMHRYLLEHKRFIDLTANQVNHPNDFFYRCHAQFLAGMLID